MLCYGDEAFADVSAEEWHLLRSMQSHGLLAGTASQGKGTEQADLLGAALKSLRMTRKPWATP